MTRSSRRKRSASVRAGFSLAEMMISSVSAMTLLAGLTSAIYVASRAVTPSPALQAATPAGLVLDEMAGELKTLIHLSSRTSTQITFGVDDRSTDPDAADEWIKYSWNGVAGSPLSRTYNGQTSDVLTDVYQFNLNYIIVNDPSTKRVLFLQGDVTGTPASHDNRRVQLMQGWGYTVYRKTVVASTGRLDLEAAARCADVVYVANSVTADHLGAKLKNTPVPVIIEQALVADSFGLTDVDPGAATASNIKIANNSHYITTPFSTGSLSLLDEQTASMHHLNSTYAPGLLVLAKDNGSNLYPNLAVLVRGGVLVDNTPSAGARVLVPWGGGVNPFNLESAATDLWQRTLDWATRKKVLTAIDITLRVGSSTGPLLVTRTETLGRPRP